jgi:hypothetical protein
MKELGEVLKSRIRQMSQFKDALTGTDSAVSVECVDIYVSAGDFGG